MKYLVVLVAMATVVGLAAQTGGESPFVGTWKLNVEKSKFDPGPANQSETVTIGADNKVTVDGVSAGGNHENWSYTYVSGQEAPITGIDNSSVTETRSGNTVTHAWKFNGGNFTGKGVLSKNGKVMTYTLDGTNSQGQHEHDVLVYEKQ